MFQIMFEIALKMDVTIWDQPCDGLTDELMRFLELLSATKNRFNEDLEMTNLTYFLTQRKMQQNTIDKTSSLERQTEKLLRLAG